MPDREVKTIKDLIYYQYAKIIARRAFDAADGKEAKGRQGLNRGCNESGFGWGVRRRISDWVVGWVGFRRCLG